MAEIYNSIEALPPDILGKISRAGGGFAASAVRHEDKDEFASRRRAAHARAEGMTKYLPPQYKDQIDALIAGIDGATDMAALELAVTNVKIATSAAMAEAGEDKVEEELVADAAEENEATLGTRIRDRSRHMRAGHTQLATKSHSLDSAKTDAELKTEHEALKAVREAEGKPEAERATAMAHYADIVAANAKKVHDRLPPDDPRAQLATNIIENVKEHKAMIAEQRGDLAKTAVLEMKKHGAESESAGSAATLPKQQLASRDDGMGGR